LYYAYLRPSEGRDAERGRLPAPPAAAGAASTWPPPQPGPGKDWTDDGHRPARPRGLKHRAQHETRSIPIPPVLVRLLRGHLKRYGTAPDGRIFRTVRGGLIQDSAYSAVWAEAPRPPRSAPAQQASPAGPAALRTCGTRGCSLALNAGVPATEAARRAGHSVAVLLKIYAPLHRRPGRRRQTSESPTPSASKTRTMSGG